MTAQTILLLLTLLLSLSAAATVWNVRPDQNSHHFRCPLTSVCYTLSQILQQYSTTHFNTDYILLFQSGVHYLDDNAIFTSDNNNNAIFTSVNTVQFSGQASKDIPIIRCRTTWQQNYSLTFQNINVKINNINFEYCGSAVSRSILATLYFIGCYDISLCNITITPSVNSSGIVIVDCQGTFKLNNYTITMEHCNNDKHTLTQYGVLINFTVNFTIDSYTYYQLAMIEYHDEVNDVDCLNYAIGIGHLQRYAKSVTIFVEQLNIGHVSNARALYYYSNACLSSSKNHLSITHSKFNSNREQVTTMFDVRFEDCWLKKSCTSQQSTITLSHCQIADNTWTTVTPLITITSMFSVSVKSQLFIFHCNFSNNNNMLILKVKSKSDLTWLYSNSITIADTNITDIIVNKKSFSLISTQHTLLSTSRLIIRNIRNGRSIIKLSNSVIQMSSLNILAYNSPRYLVYLIAGSYICMMDDCEYTILNNNVRSMFFLDGHGNKGRPCIVQLISTKGRLSGEEFGYVTNLYNVTIKNNIEKHSMFPKRELFNTTNCEMIPGAAFDYHSYVAVAKTFMMENNTNVQAHDICNCNKNGYTDCKGDQLVATYPGKTVTTKFVVPNNSDNKQRQLQLLLMSPNQIVR